MPASVQQIGTGELSTFVGSKALMWRKVTGAHGTGTSDGVIYTGLPRCTCHQLSIAKAIVILIKVNEDDMLDFVNMFKLL